MKDETKESAEAPKTIEERLASLEQEVQALKNRLMQEEQASSRLRAKVDALEQRMSKNRMR